MPSLNVSALPLLLTWKNSKHLVMTKTYPQHKEHFDTIVIDAGPAGGAAAIIRPWPKPTELRRWTC